jgi:hypothetical protein
MVGTEVWSVVYEECWRMWRVGLDRLRKAENGLEAAKAKQQMEDAESLAKLPMRVGKVPGYGEKLEKREEKTLRKEFDDAGR